MMIIMIMTGNWSNEIIHHDDVEDDDGDTDNEAFILIMIKVKLIFAIMVDIIIWTQKEMFLC